MNKPPRDRKKESLVNIRLIFYAYLFIGMMESFAGFFMYFHYMKHYAGINVGDLFLAFNKWSDGYLGKTQEELYEHLLKAQCVYFVTIVICQFGNLLATRTKHLSFFQHLPWKKETKNMKIFVAMLVSLVLAGIVIYLPFFQNVFKTREVPTEYWFIAIGWAIWIFTMAELFKFFVWKFPNLQRLIW